MGFRFSLGQCCCKGNCTITVSVSAASAKAGNHQQVLTPVGPPVDGSFTLTYAPEGGVSQTTAAIPFNATAAQVQAALAALSQIGSGNVSCGGGPLVDTSVTPYIIGPVTVNFFNALANTAQPVLTVNSSLICQETCVTVVTPCSAAPEGFFKDATATIADFTGKTYQCTLTETDITCAGTETQIATRGSCCIPNVPQGSVNVTVKSDTLGTLSAQPPTPITLRGSTSGDMANPPENFTLTLPAGTNQFTDAIIVIMSWINTPNSQGSFTSFGYTPFFSTSVAVGNTTYNLTGFAKSIPGAVDKFVSVNGGPATVGWLCMAWTGANFPQQGNPNTQGPVGTVGVPSIAIAGNPTNLVVNSLIPVNTGEIELIAFMDKNPGTLTQNAFTILLNGVGNAPATNATADVLYAKSTLTSNTPSGTVTVQDNGAADGQALLAVPFTLIPANLLPLVGQGLTQVTLGYGIPLPDGYGCLVNPNLPNSKIALCNCTEVTPQGACGVCAWQQIFGLPTSITANDGFGDFVLGCDVGVSSGTYGGGPITRTANAAFSTCEPGGLCGGAPTTMPIALSNFFFSPCGPAASIIGFEAISQVCHDAEGNPAFAPGCGSSAFVSGGPGNLEIISCDPFFAILTVAMPAPWNAIYGNSATFTFSA